MQSATKLLMVRPVRFGFNEQTADNNTFQKRGYESDAQNEALKEFDNYVSMLRECGVEVLTVEDTPSPETPDSIFPNNWLSTHEEGVMVLYPMCAPNRRLERKSHIIEAVKERLKIEELVDFTNWEDKNMFLEGTGSMVLDRINKVVYACRSPRTHEELLEQFCDKFGYDYLLFDASDESGTSIYHTNVMMSVGTEFAVVCLDSIDDLEERVSLIESLEESDREIIEISLEQMNNFAGNMLEVAASDGSSILIMSQRAKESLNPDQIQRLEHYCKIVSPSLTTIENNGGGSARCMVAELFS